MEPVTAARTLAAFENTVAPWIAALDDYSSEQLARKPSDADWSLGQLYEHLINGTRRFHLASIETCLGDGAADAGASSGGLNDNGRQLFAAGGFPPVRIAVPPSPHYTPRERDDASALKNELTEVAGLMRAAADRVADSDPSRTAPHPALGGLNAMQWYSLIEMHFRHHALQRARLDTWLAGGEWA